MADCTTTPGAAAPATPESRVERTDDEIRELFRQAVEKMMPPPAPAPALRRMNTHGSFDDLRAAVAFLGLGASALEGIGNMMHPEMSAGDEQMNFARRSDAAAVFSFFGAAFKESAGVAEDAVDFLDLKGMLPADA